MRIDVRRSLTLGNDSGFFEGRGQGIFPLIYNGKVRFITGEKWHVP